MPPIFGLGFLAVAGLCCAGIGLIPLVVAATSRDDDTRRIAGIVAGIFGLIALIAGGSCAISNARQGALLEAVESGQISEVRRLLDGGVSPDSRVDPSDPYGSPTVIHRAIGAERWDIVRLLIERGATSTYYGDDSMESQSAAGLLDAAGKKDLAAMLRRNGPSHF